MLRPGVLTAGRIDAVLDSLPEGFAALDVGDDRIVVGPTGAFVVGPAGRDVTGVADRLGRRAESCRTALASRLPWTPFVEALVVTDRSGAGTASASAVPPRMLRDTLLSGPRLLSRQAVDRVVEVLGERFAPAPAA